MTIGKRLASLREQKKLTQNELANLIKISRSRLSLYETDKREPDLETMKQLATFFDVTTDYILGRDDSTNRPTPPQEPKKPKDLKKFLEQSEVMFDGETYKLDEEDKQKLRDALEFAFWHAKQKNKRKKS